MSIRVCAYCTCILYNVYVDSFIDTRQALHRNVHLVQNTKIAFTVSNTGALCTKYVHDHNFLEHSVQDTDT